MNTFQTLCSAIVADDLTKVKSILKTDARLATERVANAWLEPRMHWFYAGDTALHLAAAGYRMEIARLLLSAGAKPNSPGTHRNAHPLHYAADGNFGSLAWNPKRQVEMIRLLLEAGAEINAQDKNGATPLHRAVRTRCAEAVNCLLDAGADAKMKNRPGSTPFHLAVQNTGRGGSGSDLARTAQRDIIQAFLDRKVSPTLKDERGKSVLEWAKSEWVREILTKPGRAV